MMSSSKKRKAEAGFDEPSQKQKHERQRQAYIDSMHNFWQKQLDKIKNTDFKNLKQHDLPLARIKKIMRSDEDVKMISAEAPVLFAKACELFILDLTMRAWSHADANRRRTLQREDVASAVADSETFDFLLDVVPRQTPDQQKGASKAKDETPTPDTNTVAAMVSENSPLEEDASQSDHRLRRPMLNPLGHTGAPIQMIMPVPVESKSSEGAAPAVKPGIMKDDPIFPGTQVQSREWPKSSGQNEGGLLLGPPTSGPSLATGHASGNLSMNLRITDPNAKPEPAGVPRNI